MGKRKVNLFTIYRPGKNFGFWEMKKEEMPKGWGWLGKGFMGPVGEPLPYLSHEEQYWGPPEGLEEMRVYLTNLMRDLVAREVLEAFEVVDRIEIS